MFKCDPTHMSEDFLEIKVLCFLGTLAILASINNGVLVSLSHHNAGYGFDREKDCTLSIAVGDCIFCHINKIFQSKKAMFLEVFNFKGTVSRSFS